jgi:hydroxyethylthiazole kinase-like uncharacterized protein yjeF
MRRLDEKAIKDYGIPSIVLMENAGRGAAEIIQASCRRMFCKAGRQVGGCRVVIVCGTGNNGGDGFVVARHLVNKGVRVQVILLGSSKKLSPDALINYKIVKKMGIKIRDTSYFFDQIFNKKRDVSLIIDAIFGTGLSRPIEGMVANVIQAMNQSKKPIVALDIPSGLNGKTGEVMGAAIKAKGTMTFGAPKTGFYKKQGPKLTGKVTIVDISIPRKLFSE